MASHAEGLKQLSKVLVHLAEAKQTADEMSTANQYGEEFQSRAAVARAAVNDTFDTVRDAISALRDHERQRMAAQSIQATMFSEGAEGERVPPPDDSDAHSDGGGSASKSRRKNSKPQAVDPSPDAPAPADA